MATKKTDTAKKPAANTQAAAKASAMPKPVMKKAAARAAKPTARRATVSQRSVADRRELARRLLSLDEYQNNSVRVLDLLLRANGATGLEVSHFNGYDHPARRTMLERVAMRFGYKVKVLSDESNDGSPRYKFV